MSDIEIPPNLKSFIAEHIRSVVELEALLLMHQDSNRQWTSAELGRTLCVDPTWAESELSDLTRRGLATKMPADPPAYRFNTQTPYLATVRLLEQFYRERRVSIIQQIFAKPSEPIQSFADAFRFRKD
ncbi:MAG TPA: hypothetical protein VHS31_13765 [Tepidisphaeraceae bacterium]|jgi:hypothetical protein|nr:hypothetical protein [Tepidisphaeraceae bacterium]